MINIVPVQDKRKHEESTTCWCCPEVEYPGGEMLIVHGLDIVQEGHNMDNIVLTEQEEAESIVEQGLCGACDAIGCNSQDVCDGFKAEVKKLLKEWAE